VLLDSSLYFHGALSVLVNGTATGFFSSFYGLKQRDHLSPLLVIINTGDCYLVLGRDRDGHLSSSVCG